MWSKVGRRTMKILILGVILIIVIAFVYGLYRLSRNHHRYTLFNLKNINLNNTHLNRLFKPVHKDSKVQSIVMVEQISPEDIKLFDDVAKLFFEKQIRKYELDAAQHIQAEFLNKMPTQTQTQIKQFDLGEWSVFWSYKHQSLEYYASCYGIFYTHVDAKGVEHKQEYMFAV